MSDDVAYKNTDRELWREPKGDLPSDYYADSIHVTEQGGIGIDCGGLVFVKTLREWHALACAAYNDDVAQGADEIPPGLEGPLDPDYVFSPDESHLNPEGC